MWEIQISVFRNQGQARECQKQFSLPEQIYFGDEMVAAPAEHIVLVVDMAQPAPGMYRKYFVCQYMKYQSQQRHNNPVLVKIKTQ